MGGGVLLMSEVRNSEKKEDDCDKSGRLNVPVSVLAGLFNEIVKEFGGNWRVISIKKSI